MKHRIGPDGDTLQVYDDEKHFRSEADPYRARPVLTTWRRRFLEDDIRSGQSVSIAELEMLGLWDPHDDSAIIRSGRARWPLATLGSTRDRGAALGLGGLTAAQEQEQKRQQLARQADSEPWSEDAKRKYRNYLDGLTPEQLLEPGT